MATVLGEVKCKKCGTFNYPTLTGSNCINCGDHLFPKSAPTQQNNKETQQTICPNCGANITNHQNCEFCGSLLIRLQQRGINIENSDYGNNSKTYPGLIRALQDNLAMQIPNNKLVATDVINEAIEGRYLASILSGLLFHDGVEFNPDALDDGKKHLMVDFCFVPDGVGGDDLRLQKFRQLDIFELFTGHISIKNGIKGYEYAIDFGEDAEGAARLLSTVFHEVYGINYDTHLDYYTNSGDDIQKCRNKLNGVEELEEKESTGNSNWWVFAISVFIGIIVFMCSID
jgi:DNA-directed RNA polymerase subunit RPC12/RpoP